MKNFTLVLLLSVFSLQIFGQCPTNCSTGEQFNFTYYGAGTGSQSSWFSTPDQNRTETYVVTNGSGGSMTVEMSLDDPNNRNIDRNNCGPSRLVSQTLDSETSCPGNDFSYGAGYMTMGMNSNNSDEIVTWCWEFSVPVQLCNWEISDIDYKRFTECNLNGAYGLRDSYQDEVVLTANNNGSPVVLNVDPAIPSGSRVNILNNNTETVTLQADYLNGSRNGDFSHNDNRGKVFVSAPEPITQICLEYSNGPDDKAREEANSGGSGVGCNFQQLFSGQSNDHAIRVSGFTSICLAQGSISGTVHKDIDNNGTPDFPLIGVTINLLDAAGNPVLDSNGNPITTTTSDGTTDINNDGVIDPAGSYYFGDVPGGDYIVEEVDPAGFVSVSDNDDDTSDPNDNESNDTDPNNNRIPVSLVSGEHDIANNFIDEQTGTISGTVLEDINGDSTGDQPVGGSTIELLDGNGVPVLDDNGVPITTVTAPNGSYTFTGVPPGDYIVRQIDLPGYTSVSDGDSTDPGDDQPNTDTNDNQIPVTIDGFGEADTGNDFVDERKGAISGRVEEDFNNNGTGDGPLVGVTIELLDAMGNVISTTTTSDGTTDLDGDGVNEPAGSYYFGDLSSGDYQVREVDPAGYGSVTDGDVVVDGPNDGETNDGDTNNNIIPVTLSTGETLDSGNNFVDEKLGEIHGFVRQDLDNNDTGDQGIGGVTINLLDAMGNPVLDDMGNPITTVTNPDGSYQFLNLRVGDYIVEEVDPMDFISVKDGDDFMDSADDGDGNPDTNDNRIPVSITTGEIDTQVNFVDELTGEISGTVSEDLNNDDLPDQPLSGVTINLLDAMGNPVLDDMGNPITTTTDANGDYVFDNVPPGDYQVQQIDLPGYISVSDGDNQADSPNDAETNDGDTNNNIIPVSLTSTGEVDGSNDFLDEQPGTIAGRVLEDTDGDDDGEQPIPGVLISLLDAMGNPVLDDNGNPITTITDANGDYVFDNVPPGDYIVAQSQPIGFVDVKDIDSVNDGPDDGELGEDGLNDNRQNVSLTGGGESDTGIDFIEEQLGQISGFVRADTQGNGTGDVPLAGVLIELLDDMGNPVLDAFGSPITTFTEPDGSYIFADVPAGSYLVRETDPSGYQSVGDSDDFDDGVLDDDPNPDTNDNVLPVTISPGGEVDTEVNFVDELIPLPVRGLTISLKRSTGGVSILWRTSSEYNNKEFRVEHSRDGLRFETIGVVAGAGTVSTPRSYSYEHATPIPGINYYRLTQVDLDGAEELSPIASIFLQGKTPQVVISPNPFGDYLWIRDLSAGTVVNMYNGVGKLVLTTVFDGSALDVAELENGVYYLELVGYEKVFKLVKM